MLSQTDRQLGVGYCIRFSIGPKLCRKKDSSCWKSNSKHSNPSSDSLKFDTCFLWVVYNHQSIWLFPEIGGTPSHHPFLNKNHPFLGTPFMETPMSGCFNITACSTTNQSVDTTRWNLHSFASELWGTRDLLHPRLADDPFFKLGIHVSFNVFFTSARLQPFSGEKTVNPC